MSVCSIDRQQQRRTGGLLLSALRAEDIDRQLRAPCRGNCFGGCTWARPCLPQSIFSPIFAKGRQRCTLPDYAGCYWCCSSRSIQEIKPTATNENTRKVFSIWVVISLVGTISGKSLKLLPPDVTFNAKMHQIRFRLRLSPRPRWWSLQRFPRPLSWTLRVYF